MSVRFALMIVYFLAMNSERCNNVNFSNFHVQNKTLPIMTLSGLRNTSKSILIIKICAVIKPCVS